MNLRSHYAWSIFFMVLLASLILGIGFLKIFEKDNPVYQMRWAQSNWISYPDSSASSYFRIPLDIPTEVDKAVLQLAATDAYQIFLNGTEVAKKSNKSTIVNGVFDVSQLLHPGKNILAVAVNRSSYPAQAGLRFELKVIDTAGQYFDFGSKGGEPVEYRAVNDRETNISWYETTYNDSVWRKALSRDEPTPASFTNFDPALLLSLPKVESRALISVGNWKVTISKTFQIEAGSFQHGWIGVSSDAPFEIFLNGSKIGEFAAEKQHIILHSISSSLKRGTNELSIDFITGGSSAEISGGILLAGNHQLEFYGIDREWQFFGQSSNTSSALNEVKTQFIDHSVLMVDNSNQTELPFIVSTENNPFQLNQLKPWLGVFIYFSGYLLLFLLFIMTPLTIQNIIEQSLWSNLVLILLLMTAWFVAQDIRFDGRLIFSNQNLLILYSVWFLLSFASVFEYWFYHKKEHQGVTG